MGMRFEAASSAGVVFSAVLAALVACLPAHAQTAPPGANAVAAQSAGAAESAQFDVMEYRVIGNTVLTNREIERILYPLLGPHKTLKDVEAAKTALETFYHDHGYGTIFVDIPPQKVNDGVVRLRVTEGRIESEQIAGARYFPERDVIAALPSAQPGTVLQLSKLQSELAAVNTATPDRSVVPILKAGSAPGTVDLKLQVNDTLPLHGSLELNNQASLDTDSLRAVASLSYGDMFGRLDNFSFQFQTTPQRPDQVKVFAANYAFHPLESGLAPSLQYINSNSNVAAVGTLGVLGIGQIGGVRLAYPFPAATASNQSVTFGVDYKHFRNLVNQNATTAVDSPISYLNLSFAYAGLWRSDWHTTSFTASANAGPRHLVNSESSFEAFRAEGNANYFYLRGDLTNDFKLPGGFVLRLRAAGQAAAEPLITNEDFSIAGVDGVRGYLESEVLGDEGLKETVQLTSPRWRLHERVIGDLFSFFDEGRTWDLASLSCQPGGTGLHLRSWGGGFDLLPGQKVTGGVTWARALDSATDLPPVAVSGGCPASGPATRAGDSRVLFFVRGSF
jgi:hemolysin activation/secretion protein